MRVLRRFPRIFSVVWIIPLMAACTTVPVTGRSSLNLVSEAQLAQLSTDQYKQVLQDETLSTDSEDVQMVRRVGARLADATERFLRESGYEPDFNWEFNLIEDDETVNAWAMPGGKVAVYSGILPVAETEAGLAAIMSHEIAHVIARHGSERMSQQLVAQMGGQALGAVLGENPGLAGELFQAAYGVGSDVGVLLPFSRLQESEADRIGLTIMAIAGYDPAEMIGLWQRMEQVGGARPATFLSTHPNPSQRIENIRRFLPEAQALYNRETAPN